VEELSDMQKGDLLVIENCYSVRLILTITRYSPLKDNQNKTIDRAKCAWKRPKLGDADVADLGSQVKTTLSIPNVFIGGVTQSDSLTLSFDAFAIRHHFPCEGGSDTCFSKEDTASFFSSETKFNWQLYLKITLTRLSSCGDLE
jgi:hypothetical protein